MASMIKRGCPENNSGKWIRKFPKRWGMVEEGAKTNIG